MPHTGNDAARIVPTPETHDRIRVLRKAHWRMQKHGPGLALSKRIRIRESHILVWRLRNDDPQLAFDLPVTRTVGDAG